MPVAKRPAVRKRPAQPEHAGPEPVPATRQERNALICRLAAEGQKKVGRGFLRYAQERLPEPVVGAEFAAATVGRAPTREHLTQRYSCRAKEAEYAAVLAWLRSR